MKTYYIQQDDQQQGPFSIDELKKMQINPAVPVRTEGFKNWIKAREIPELYKALFAGHPQVAPVYAETQKGPLQPVIEKTGPAAGRNRKTVLVVLTLLITGFLIVKLQQSESYASASVSVSAIEKSNQPVKTTAQLKEERRKKELASPATYIKIKLNWRKNLVGETVLEGTLTNTATLASFKDPVVVVTWLSKTNTVLTKSRYPLYEYLGARKTISYKMKVKALSKYNNVKASVESATALQ